MNLELHSPSERVREGRVGGVEWACALSLPGSSVITDSMISGLCLAKKNFSFSLGKEGNDTQHISCL